VELSKYGCSIQCTSGKCSKAAHPTCAENGHDGSSTSGRGDNGWLVDFVDGDEADRLEARGRYCSKGKGKGKANGKSTPSAQSPDGDASEDAVPASGDSERLVVLCRAHNPRYRLREQQRRLAQLYASVRALSLGDEIKVKVSGAGAGVWSVIVAGAIGTDANAVVPVSDIADINEEGEILVVDAAAVKMRAAHTTGQEMEGTSLPEGPPTAESSQVTLPLSPDLPRTRVRWSKIIFDNKPAAVAAVSTVDR